MLASLSPVVQPLLRISTVLGPVLPAISITSAHVAGLVIHVDRYVEAPPTISRLLADPTFAAPFSWAMIVSAFFLSLAIYQVIVFLLTRMKVFGQENLRNRILLLIISACETVAVAGMIVLSQFTGSQHSQLHDVGSYMLFFGHAVGIVCVGLLIRNLRSGKALAAKSSATNSARDAAFSILPRRAAQVAMLSVLYGVVYFGGKALPDEYFFWQRLVMSILEMVVILSFLGFLYAFRRQVQNIA